MWVWWVAEQLRRSTFFRNSGLGCQKIIHVKSASAWLACGTVRSIILGSLSINDCDGYEKGTNWRNQRCLKLYHAYSILFKSSNVGTIFFELNSKGLYQSSGKEKKFFVLSRRPRQNMKLVIFTSYSCSDGKEMAVQKSVMYVRSCFFAKLNLLLFYRHRCRHHRRCLSSPLMFSHHLRR